MAGADGVAEVVFIPPNKANSKTFKKQSTS